MRLRYLAVLLLLTPLLLTPLLLTPLSWSQSIPRSLQGTWRVTAVLPTQTGCWAGEKAENLLNTTITYSAGHLGWNGHTFPIDETLTRTLTPAEFRGESSRYAKDGAALELASLGIRAPRVTELDLQHDDADITDVTTEIPGDTVLLAGPNRILITVCGPGFEASRASSRTVSASQAGPRRSIRSAGQMASKPQSPKAGL